MTSSSLGMESNTKLKAWYAATRPRVFVASFVPMGFAVLAAFEAGVFHLGYFILSLIGVMCLQTAANLINEYADFKRGADELKQAGQSMTLKNKLLSAEEIRNGAIVSVLAGCFIGLFLLSQSGIWLLWIGLGGVIVAITYTAGPFPLAYNGLGEVAAGIFMGPLIVIGAYYVMDPSLSAEAGLRLALISFPIMFSTAAILHANNLRDLEADKSVNKRTLAVIFGRRIARVEYQVLWIASYASHLVLVLAAYLPLATLIALLTVPQAMRLVQIFNQETDPLILHPAQGATAQLHGKYGLLIVLAWAASLLVAALS